MKSPFRSIRQTLFNEGKLLRYLTYAVGEVVLIIVGILILNRRQQRKQRQGIAFSSPFAPLPPVGFFLSMKGRLTR